MDVTPEQVEAGHALYTKRFLRVYDLVVLSLSSTFAWKCPSSRIVQHYDEHVSANHLDVGVGTGYFLDKCRFPSTAPRVALMDLSENCLNVAGRRIARYSPERYVANVLEPIRVQAPKFDSVAMNYLLHCLPGTIRTKAVALEHLKTLVNPNGVIFGATMLNGGVKKNLLARRMMKRVNERRVFTNTHDDLESLRWALSQHLSDPQVEIVGTAALFWGRV